MTEVQAIEWAGEKLRLLDQTKLPVETTVFEADRYQDVIRAVKEMRVRGAPALGVVAAYGVAMAARDIPRGERGSFLTRLKEAGREIESARPTAVNMTWAVRRLLDLAEAEPDAAAVPGRLLDEARTMQEEDEEVNRRIGRFGSEILPDAGAVLTHCNTGALATAGYGTALGVIRAAWEAGKRFHVFHTETRPFLQGARLTAWELVQLGIPSTLIVDSSAGVLLSQGEVSCVVVGADRIAANGDVANKVGTYTLAVLSNENGVPFYVAAPTSTVDLSLSSGEDIPIEERRAEEVTSFGGVRTAPEGIGVWNPSFDVTPHKYVGGIITEVGILTEPYTESLARSVTGR
jgi:methylthioribose-1-phosphate isomerase